MDNTLIQCPQIGTVVKHTGYMLEHDKNYPCDVYINSGTFFSPENRITN